MLRENSAKNAMLSRLKTSKDQAMSRGIDRSVYIFDTNFPSPHTSLLDIGVYKLASVSTYSSHPPLSSNDTNIFCAHSLCTS
jgi:hypothetical protein